MNNVEQWYNEASELVNVHTDGDNKFLIYKGFKIEKSETGYKAWDVRHSEFYSVIKQEDLNYFLKFGFIKGADYVNYFRNKVLIDDYNTTIKALYEKKLNSQKELPKNRKLNEKRIRVANEKIDYYGDLIMLLQSRNKYLKIKYNLENE